MQTGYWPAQPLRPRRVIALLKELLERAPGRGVPCGTRGRPAAVYRVACDFLLFIHRTMLHDWAANTSISIYRSAPSVAAMRKEETKEQIDEMAIGINPGEATTSTVLMK